MNETVSAAQCALTITAAANLSERPQKDPLTTHPPSPCRFQISSNFEFFLLLILDQHGCAEQYKPFFFVFASGQCTKQRQHMIVRKESEVNKGNISHPFPPPPLVTSPLWSPVTLNKFTVVTTCCHFFSFVSRTCTGTRKHDVSSSLHLTNTSCSQADEIAFLRSWLRPPWYWLAVMSYW